MQPKEIAKKVDALHAARWETVIQSLRMPYLLSISSKKHGFHVEEVGLLELLCSMYIPPHLDPHPLPLSLSLYLFLHHGSPGMLYY